MGSKGEKSRGVVFHESQTIDDIEKPTISQKKNVADQMPEATTEPFMRNGATVPEDIPEVEDNEESDDAEQGEPQPHLSDVPGPSQGQDDGGSPQIIPKVRRSERGRIPSSRYPESEYLLLTEDGEPENFHEAVSHKDKEKWFLAMQDEMESL